MAVRLRLTRVGGKKDPMWRVVVADQRSPRDGRVIETIGHYNAQTEPSTIVIDEERARSWLARGAQPSDTVRKLLRIQGIADARPASEPRAEREQMASRERQGELLEYLAQGLVDDPEEVVGRAVRGGRRHGRAGAVRRRRTTTAR